MPRKTAAAPPLDPIERDFLDAIDRLESGTPSNPALAKQAKLGTLKINVAVVAREAGHSRTLIGHTGCKYPRVRGRVIALKTPVPAVMTPEAVIRRLREENAELRKKLLLRDTENATLMVRLHQTEREHQRIVRKLKRSATRGESPRRAILRTDGSPETAEVVPFPAPKDE